MEKFSNTFLAAHRERAITSVFLPTTQSATMTLMSGLAPAEHGLLAWYMSLKEMGINSVVLPWWLRLGKTKLPAKFSIKDLTEAQNWVNGGRFKAHTLMNQAIKNSSFTQQMAGRSSVGAYRTVAGLFRQLSHLMNATKERNFTYVYYPHIDTAEHIYGTNSEEARVKILEIDHELEKFCQRQRGSKTLVIITADHGLIDTLDPSHRLNLGDFPELVTCLSQPLTGEPRTGFAYVHPDRQAFFEHYLATVMHPYLHFYSRQQILNQGWFGPGKPHQMLAERMGDYVLTMKEDYILKDFLVGEPTRFSLANHGGVSHAEQFVPLITINL